MESNNLQSHINQSSKENDFNVFEVHGLDGIVGAIYARYSRSSDGFKEIVQKEFMQDGEFLTHKADELIQRVLIQYGDDSVGELEGTHISFEGVSNLAVKEIEDKRIGGSYIEKSSRYVLYDTKENGQWKYVVPPELDEFPEIKAEYVDLMNSVFLLYKVVVNGLIDYFSKEKPLKKATYDIDGLGAKTYDQTENKKGFERTWKNDIRTRACDIARALLPASTKTNLGTYGNGRYFQSLISKLLTSDLKESVAIGEDLKDILSARMGNYVKRAKEDAHKKKITKEIKDYIASYSLKGDNNISQKMFSSSFVSLIENQSDISKKIQAMTLFPHVFSSIEEIYKSLGVDAGGDIFEIIFGERDNRRGFIPRSFESGYPLCFEFVTDFGIYRDLQRHRMLSQQRQLLTPYLGFEWDDLVLEKYFSEVSEVLGKVESLYEKISSSLSEEVAQYCVLFGHRVRYVMEMNFREAFHLIELRTSAQGHKAYRKICQDMYVLLGNKFDFVKKYMLANVDFVEWPREESESKQRQKEIQIQKKECIGNVNLENYETILKEVGLFEDNTCGQIKHILSKDLMFKKNDPYNIFAKRIFVPFLIRLLINNKNVKNKIGDVGEIYRASESSKVFLNFCSKDLDNYIDYDYFLFGFSNNLSLESKIVSDLVDHISSKINEINFSKILVSEFYGEMVKKSIFVNFIIIY